eukprot:5705792-Heterocapsa_arctica.AAC.1
MRAYPSITIGALRAKAMRVYQDNMGETEDDTIRDVTDFCLYHQNSRLDDVELTLTHYLPNFRNNYVLDF